MAEFVTVMKERKRMCDRDCNSCTLSVANNGLSLVCDALVRDLPETAEKIIMEWVAEHPRETMQEHFFKLFPNAPKSNDKNGTPKPCPFMLGWGEYCGGRESSADCVSCWSQPYEGE